MKRLIYILALLMLAMPAKAQLYPELYTKKQLKLSVPLIEYVSDIADGIFREFDEYMQQQ